MHDPGRRIRVVTLTRIDDVIPRRERLRSSGVDGIFKRAPNARIRKVAGVVTGSNGIPLPLLTQLRCLLRKPRRI